MDFYDQPETPEEIERKRRERMMLPRARVASAGGAVTNTVQSGEENILRALELYGQDDDYSQAQQYVRERAMQGDRAMLNALAAQYAGARFEPVQGQYLKRALAAQDPLRVGSAMIAPDGSVIRDPSSSRQNEANKLMQLGQFQMTQSDRRQARADALQEREENRRERARDRAALASQGTWQSVTDPRTGQVVLFNNKTGKTMPLPGGEQPAEPNEPRKPGFSFPQGVVPDLTETQEKSRFYTQNMVESLPVMADVLKQGYTPNRQDQVAAGPQATGFIGATANAVVPRSFATEQGRKFYNAGRQVLAAILRKESGAAITDDEWATYGPIYLPWPGESKQERDAKMRKLYSMTDNMALGAGSAYRFYSPLPMFSDEVLDDAVIDLPSPGR